MITFFILLALLILGIVVFCKGSYYNNIDILGFTLILVSSMFLLIHLISVFLVSYEYEIFVEKRNAFEQTLNESRKSTNPYETAAIVKEISEWNKELAERKYDNKTILFDQYIDNRIDDLDYIK